ncbi:MAG: acyl-CoA thioesterase [Chlorobiota bacterium]|jgi:acyl-CoA thioester hydrolase|nr:acyl-CoA thioesterase [Chlorobiota bacterium]QQS66842.1 MAG: acyl-CoA thioesterase [Chlorobiota bacterium]
MSNYVATGETTLRVRFTECDSMQVVHHSQYIRYFEIGRTEIMRAKGLPYSVIEKEGFFIIVLSVECSYLKPARYDDVLTLKAKLRKLTGVRLYFDYEILNEKNELLVTGTTCHAFADSSNFKPVKPPKDFIEIVCSS